MVRAVAVLGTDRQFFRHVVEKVRVFICKQRSSLELII